MFDETTAPNGISPEVGHDTESGATSYDRQTRKALAFKDFAATFNEMSARINEKGMTDERARAEVEKIAAEKSGLPVGLFSGLNKLREQVAQMKAQQGDIPMPFIQHIAQAYAEMAEQGNIMNLPNDDLAEFIGIVHPELSPQDRKEIMNHLTSMRKPGKGEDEKETTQLTPEEREVAEARVDEAEGMVETMYLRLNKFQQMFPTAEDKFNELAGIYEKYKKKFEKFMNPDDPLKTWSKRGIKLNFKLLQWLFYAFLIECAIVSRMTKQQGSRR